MKIARFAAASDGGSQFVEVEMPTDNASTDAFGNTVRRSAILPAQSTMVTEMPEGFYQDWHPASRRQLLIVLSGTVEVETSDGKKHRCGSGEVFLADDVGSRGHRTRTIGGRPACFLCICRPKPMSAANRRLGETTIAYYDRFARALPGGERARLTLARAFARPSNLLVLDEPTNDLDLETLDLLQERLAEYAGTVLLVSHDRDFLDRVVTSTIASEATAGGSSTPAATPACWRSGPRCSTARRGSDAPRLRLLSKASANPPAGHAG
jgi:hypothetical protein